MSRESSLQITCRGILKAEGAKGVKANPTNGAGTPDWLGSYLGRSLALEFKAPGADRTERGRRRRQLHEQVEWAAAGAVVATIRSTDELRRVLAFVKATTPDPRLPGR